MPWLFVLLIAVLVNFSSSLQAQENTTQIRGPRGTDTVAKPEQIGPLSPSDTLWRVAERIKPAGNISLYQVMYALYLKNPDAFLENNLNHLKPGAILVLPSLQEIQQVELSVARQKSEQDDQVWAQRQKPAGSSKAVAPVASVEAATPWQAELKRLDELQRQQLDGLRSQFADSMQLVETMVQENLQLKTSLSKLQQELELLKAELGDDSAIQQQIELLLKQQAELLQAKAAEDAAAKAAAEQGFNWQSVLQNPLSWVLAACIPALLVLFSILLWVKKRGQKTEEVINAARTEPQVDPGYHSPLPPLEDNDELDESLFEIDDALLEDAFTDETVLTQGSEVEDDLLQFDDTLSFEDDSLLPPATAEQAETAAIFDADNILSDTDLSALLAADDEDEAIIELADDDSDNLDDWAAESVSGGAADKQNPASLATVAADNIAADTVLAEDDFDEFDIDELIEEVTLDDEDELAALAGQEQDMLAALSQQAEPLIPEPQPEPLTPEPDFVIATDDTVIESEVTADDGLIAEEQQRFNSSELEEFAESLVAESTAAQDDRDDSAAEYELTNAEEALLSAELAELLDQVDVADNETADEAAINVVSPEDIGLDITQSELDNALDDVLLDDTDAIAAENNTLLNLDLTASDDSSVSRPTEAAMSVENPSKILAQYPELELADDDLLSDIDSVFELADTDEQNTADTVEIELDPLPEAQFDTLMSELEAMADNLDQAEATADNSMDFNLADDTTALTDIVAEDFDFSDDDFVEIDKLLASAEQQELDPERFNKLNVDVGLDEFADIIGEHERRDVDQDDNGFAAKLDLVRAYIEIDDTESAELLLDDILESDAPDSVKTEALKLKQAD